MLALDLEGLAFPASKALLSAVAQFDAPFSIRYTRERGKTSAYAFVLGVVIENIS